jgi:hypothetical protein
LRKLCSILSVPCLVLLAIAGLSQASQAQILRDRITQPIDSANAVALAGSVHPQVRGELDQGLSDNSKVLAGMTINFKRTEAQ